MPIKAAAESIAAAERQRLGLGDAPIPPTAGHPRTRCGIYGYSI